MLRRLWYFASGVALLLAPRLPWIRLGAKSDVDLQLAFQVALFSGGVLIGAALLGPFARPKRHAP